MSAPELEKKSPFKWTWAFILAVAGASLFLGMNIQAMLDKDMQTDANKEAIKELKKDLMEAIKEQHDDAINYTTQEVDGLRNDVNFMHQVQEKEIEHHEHN
jgi:hypothetical protein